MTEIFGLLEAGARVADVARSFEGNGGTFYCLQACFRQSGSEKDRPRSGRPRITIPREVRFMMTSSRRKRFMAAPQLVEPPQTCNRDTNLRFYCQKASEGSWTEI